MGHFLAARAFGVKVHEFMVGLPGPALRLHTKNMDWGVTAVPLGGYVRIAGMEPGAEDELLGDALVAIRDHGPLGIADGSPRYSACARARRGDPRLARRVEGHRVLTGTTSYALAVDGDTTGLDASGALDAARAIDVPRPVRPGSAS